MLSYKIRLFSILNYTFFPIFIIIFQLRFQHFSGYAKVNLLIALC